MAKFVCTKCGELVSFCLADEARFLKQGWQCLLCYSIIAEGRYPKNIIGCRTIFSPLGYALGDHIMSEVVMREYARENPDEQIIYTDNPINFVVALQKPYGKVFIANISQIGQKMKDEIAKTLKIEDYVPPERIGPVQRSVASIAVEWPPMGDNVYKYNMTVEASEYAKRGIYPQWTEFEKIETVDEPYIVISARNIRKGAQLEKNIKPEYLKAILDLFADIPIYFVGNDSPVDSEASRQNVIDLRHKLNLNEIAFLLRGAKMLIGPDNGIIHLGAAAGCKNIVAWNYHNRLWYPKTEPLKYTTFLKKDSSIENVLNAIKTRLEI